ncbi:MAG: RNA polymerase sigma-70 factor [Mangrovibacterium sp.]
MKPRIGDIDSVVLSKLRDNDLVAFEKVYMAYSEKLFHFAFSYLKSTFEAEEIVQEVFIQVWEMRHQIDPGRSFDSLIHRMTINRVYNQMKHQVVKQKYQNYLTQFDSSLQDSPEAALHFKQLEAKINLLLTRLPEQQRTVFEMSRMKGLSHAQIANELGLSVRTVENQVYRASRFLKEHLKGEYLWALFCLCYIFN